MTELNKIEEKVLDDFLKKLGEQHHKNLDGFSVFCKKCGSDKVTIYHNCDYYSYSSYTSGFEGSCGLKCKNCGNASEIERTYD
jgi:hypothetical protein